MLNKQLRKLKFLFMRLLRIKGNAHGVARGFTVGVLINFVPSFGFGPFLSTMLPKLVRGNAVAGFIGGVIFLWAFPILFYINIVVGEYFTPVEIAESIEEVIEAEETEEVIEAGLQIGKAFIIGMFVNMFVFGILTYLTVYTIVKKFRHEVLMFIYMKWRV